MKTIKPESASMTSYYFEKRKYDFLLVWNSECNFLLVWKSNNDLLLEVRE